MTEEDPHDAQLSALAYRLVVVAFAAIALFYLWEEHRAHLLGALPYALLALCPFLHLFLHRGHRGHAGHGGTT